ncbi:DinB family protein [Roseomonas sp. 18066]|uniref:DinB family protein n=1 Tax=Roseomonas sp. 18066 TaxID=2681412 RepID=UPI001359FD91|nr:DinB family protein [Roseomonas sp. 18066]
MTTPAFCRMMATYNSEMNRRFYAAAAGLTEAQRREDRGAFFGSLQGTLCHVLWADTIWLHRFTGSPPPPVSIDRSASMIEDFAALRAERARMDGVIEAWAGSVSAAVLDGELAYYSGAMGREVRRPMALLAVHLFNHQTHHRGQAHALLTSFGAATGDTDLPAIFV